MVDNTEYYLGSFTLVLLQWSNKNVGGIVSHPYPNILLRMEEDISESFRIAEILFVEGDAYWKGKEHFNEFQDFVGVDG